MSVTSGQGHALGNIDDRILLRVGEAAAVLSVSRWTIYRWVEEGRLRGTKVGKSSLRIFRDSIVGLVERNEIDIPNTCSASKGL
jgi:excisionase family DNA binding protein